MSKELAREKGIEGYIKKKYLKYMSSLKLKRIRRVKKLYLSYW